MEKSRHSGDALFVAAEELIRSYPIRSDPI